MIMQGISNVNNTVKLMVGIFLGIGINTVSAQTQTDDKELRLNKDVVKMIQFDFSGMEVPESQPEEAPVDKKWMNFKTDIGIPRSLLDTTIVKSPKGISACCHIAFGHALATTPFTTYSSWAGRKKGK